MKTETNIYLKCVSEIIKSSEDRKTLKNIMKSVKGIENKKFRLVHDNK